MKLNALKIIAKSLMKRFALMLWMLFGISIISFAFVQLAPGDGLSVAQGNMPISEKSVAEERRIFALDLPLFLNPSLKGAPEYASKLCRELAPKPNSRTRINALIRCGTACLPEVANRLYDCQTLSEKSRIEIIDAIRKKNAELSFSHDREVWIKEALSKTSLSAYRDLKRIGKDDESYFQELKKRGSASLPYMMDEVFAKKSPQWINRAGVLVKEVEGYRELNTLDDWREWWRQYERHFRRWEGSAAFFASFSETQYAKWLSRFIVGEFGYSLNDGERVKDKISRALPITLLLSGLSFVLSYFFAILIALHFVYHQKKRHVRWLRNILFFSYSLPPFWVAMLLLSLFAGMGAFDIFPLYGLSSEGIETSGSIAWFFDRLWHLILPVFCLSYASVVVLCRYQERALHVELSRDYILLAKAKGLSRLRVLFSHALPNALLPMITLMGLHIPMVISGSVIIEKIFNIPGMGLLVFDAFLKRDTPVIMAVLVLSAILTLIGIFFSDLLYRVVDPRIRLSEENL